MTVATQSNLVSYDGDNVAVTFPFTFPVYNADHLLVYSQDKTTLVQTPVVGFSVSGVGNENGGSVTLLAAPASTTRVLITRQLPITQDLDVQNQGGFYPDNFEAQLDLLTMEVQQIDEKLARSIFAPLGESFVALPPPPERAGNLLGFTDDDDALLTVDTATLLFNLFAAVLQSGPGIDINATGGVITITNSHIEDSWLLEDGSSGSGGGGSSTAEDIRDIIGTALRGLGCEIVVDDAADTITIDLTQASTAEIIRDVMGTALTAGTLVTVTPNDGGDIITVALDTTALDERTRDTMATALVAGTGIVVTVDDAGNTITIGLGSSILSIVSSAIVTPTSTYSQVNVTAQAVNLMLANPTGTPTDGQGLLVRIKDNGVSRTLTYGAKYRTFNDALPAATVINKTLYIGAVYNEADDKWDVLGVRSQA